eukprot:43558-Pyramimonas_sp.AAC.3
MPSPNTANIPFPWRSTRSKQAMNSSCAACGRHFWSRAAGWASTLEHLPLNIFSCGVTHVLATSQSTGSLSWASGESFAKACDANALTCSPRQRTPCGVTVEIVLHKSNYGRSPLERLCYISVTVGPTFRKWSSTWSAGKSSNLWTLRSLPPKHILASWHLYVESRELLFGYLHGDSSHSSSDVFEPRHKARLHRFRV